MSKDYIQALFADRIGGQLFGKDKTVYKFEKIKIAKREAIKQNPHTELLDMGVGEPDEMALSDVVKTLQEECAKPENRGYADNGIFEFKEAAAKYLHTVFGVKNIDPEKEIVHSIGSKPALAMFPSLLINKDDIVLMTTPGYPVLGTHAKWHNGEVVNLPLYEKNNFLPDLDTISGEVKQKAKILYLNYPNNPTGATASVEFYKKAISFAKENQIIIVQDAAYSALTHDGSPLSFLSIEGAIEVGVEIHSCSKAYNMTGWRLAFVAGNELLVKAFSYVKDNYDSGQFIPIQKAGIHALNHPEITDKINEKYNRRLKLLVSALRETGFDVTMPGGTFYLYVKAPKGIKNGKKFNTAEDFSHYLITEKLISTVPWDDAGNFIRFSATFKADGIEDEIRVMKEIKNRLHNIQLVY